jgi:hypothetical protein
MCLSAATLGIWAFCTFLQGRTIGRLGYRKTFVLGAVVAALFFAVIPYSASAYVATPLISCVYIGIVMTQASPERFGPCAGAMSPRTACTGDSLSIVTALCRATRVLCG